MYGTYVVVSQIKRLNFSDKDEICKELWTLYFWDFASMIINVVSVISNFTSDINNKR